MSLGDKPVHRPFRSLLELISQAARILSMICFASANASSWRALNERRVDRDKRGRSARVAYTLTHHFDHSRLETMSYPR